MGLAGTSFASTLDTPLLLGLCIASGVALLYSLLPIVRGNIGFGLLSVLGAIFYYWRAFPGFLLVIAAAYLLVRCIGSCSNPDQRWNRTCAILFLLPVVFTAGRLEQWDQAALAVHSSSFFIYSLDMWLLLRLVTLFWEVGSGAIAPPGLLRFILWVCLPFTLAGPLMRLSEVPPAPLPNPRLWKWGGLWKEIALAAATLAAGIGIGYGQTALGSYLPHAHFLRNAISVFFAGPFSFYLTFAGYYRFMQALALPCGLKVQPSFNFPMGRENISSFWMNWNMTATFVFRDYLFYNRWGRQTYNIYFNTILLFTLVGLWHSTNTYWALWGFIHGLLFCTFLLWRKYNSRLGWLPFRGTRAANLAARCLTYFAVCIAWYLPSKIIQKAPVIAFNP